MERATRGLIFDYSIIAIILAVIGYAFVGVYFGLHVLTANDQMVDFHKSAGCVPEGVATDPLQSSCTWAAYTVRTADRRKEFGKTRYLLSLTAPQGVVSDVQVPAAMYHRNPVGSTVQVETWGDIPVQVADDTATATPPTNPDIAIKAVRSTFGLVTLSFALAIAAIVGVLAWTTRMLVATKPPAEFVDEPMVMEPDLPMKPALTTPPPAAATGETLPWRAIEVGDDDSDRREDW